MSGPEIKRPDIGRMTLYVGLLAGTEDDPDPSDREMLSDLLPYVHHLERVLAEGSVCDIIETAQAIRRARAND